MTRPRGQIVKLPNGKWQIRIGYTENGQRRYYKRSGFDTKEAATYELSKQLVTLGKGRSIDASRQTVEMFLVSWYDIYSKSGKISAAQLRSVQTNIRAYLVPRIGQVPLRKLKAQTIAGLLADLLAGGRIHAHYQGASPQLSPKTVRNIGATLSRALTDATKWGLIPSNPFENVDLPRKTRTELTTWNGQQIAHFIATAYRQRDPMRALWLLALTVGLRRGELLGLRWSDIDLDAGVIHIEQTRQSVGAKIVTKPPKTRAGHRTCSLDTQTVGALAMLKRDQEAAAAKLGYWYSDLVATDLDGRPVHPKALLKRFKAATRAAGLPVIRLHDARHTYAAYALENGVSPHIVAARLGHSSASFTLDTYAKSIPAADKGASEIVESALTAQLRALLGREKGANLDEMTEIGEPDKQTNRANTRKKDHANEKIVGEGGLE